MRIYLVQHGLAKEKRDDANRPLSAQGLEDVTRTAGFLNLFEKPQPLRILHSGVLRAEQSASIFSQSWGGICCEEAGNLGPNDDPSIWAADLSSIDDDLMLVGHLPYMQRLAGLLLCGDASREAVHFCNGGVLCLERRETGWSVLWQINPALVYGEH